MAIRPRLPNIQQRPPGLRSPLYMIGSKGKISAWVIDHFPRHRVYVEPFGGSASVLLAKEPSKVEVYNDLDANLVTFFKVLRDRTWELAAKAAFTPCSRQIYEDVVLQWKQRGPPADDLQRAWEWLILAGQSFAGHVGTGWAHNRLSGSAGGRWARAVGSLVDVAERFQAVQVENRDFREVLRDYDGEDTLFYVDPPYVDTDHYYHNVAEMAWKDHVDLAQLLDGAQGKVVLSYYDHPVMRPLYDRWRRDALNVIKSSYGVTKNSLAQERPRAQEILLMNFP